MATEEKDGKTMQESWVEVPQTQREGTLVHSHSKEKMEELLAAAVSENEEGGEGEGEEELTGKKMFEVRFAPYEEPEPPYGGLMTEPLIEEPTKVPPTPSSDSSSRTRSCRRVLFLLVPVLLLTHLAFFGIGYYLGRRFSVEKVVTVFHV